MKHLKKFGYFSLNESVNLDDIKKKINSLVGKNIDDIDVTSIGEGFGERDIDGDNNWRYQDLVYLTDDSREYIVALLTLDKGEILRLPANPPAAPGTELNIT